MKKVIIFVLSVLCLSLAVSSCKKDYMDGPDAQIYGEIVDKQTGELVQQDIYNGSLIRYKELAYENPSVQISYFKVDGTFANKLFFSGKYDFFLNQGNFVPDTLRNVNISKGENHLKFEVTPYLTLKNVVIKQTSTNNVTATFNIKQNTSDKVDNIAIFVHGNAAVGYGTNNAFWRVFVNGDVPEDYTMQISFPIDTYSDYVARGNTYYFRVGAQSEANAAKYNYATAVKLTLW